MRTLPHTRDRPSTRDAALTRLQLLLDPSDAGSPSTPDPHPPPEAEPGCLRQALAARGRRAAEAWLPVGLRGARTDPGRRGAAALVLVALLAALGAGMLAWHGRPRSEPVVPPPVLAGAPPAVGGVGSPAPPAGSLVASPAAPAGLPAGPAASPAAPAGSLVVAVTGRVHHPGVVTVPAGARVIDAVKAAGGPLPGADLALLNLARKVADGELVVVGVPADAAGSAGGAPVAGGGGGPAAGDAGSPIDLNAATLADLDTLPGVGPVLAQRILDWRTEHGRFAAVDQLADVPGIGESRLAQLRDLVRV